MPVVFDDINSDIILVLKGCDVLGARILTHLSASVLKSFDKDDSLVGSHVEAIGK